MALIDSATTARLEHLRLAMRTQLTDTDPAHDYAHVLRVAALAEHLARVEGADVSTVVAAALLHELFNYPKGHPDSARSGEVCAEHATEWLRTHDWPAAQIEPIAYCIRVHPFSRRIRPETLEGRVLQDADRLDAIGAIGIARCFATCSSMGRPFYSPEDPFCRAREPEDKLWGVDHFYRKLLRLAGQMHTAEARRLAAERSLFMETFLAQLARELPGG
jgi:uncharacterized protein